MSGIMLHPFFAFGGRGGEVYFFILLGRHSVFGFELADEVGDVFKSAVGGNFRDVLFAGEQHFLRIVKAEIQQVFVEILSHGAFEKYGKRWVAHIAHPGDLCHGYFILIVVGKKMQDVAERF